MFAGIKRICRLFIFKKQWRKCNPHNHTYAANLFALESVVVGKATYGPLNVVNCGTGNTLRIGNYCSIAQDVIFSLHADHYLNRISTYPFRVMAGGEKQEAISKGDIILEDDVWIGQRAMIMSGIRIGQGAVVAAGAVVTKDVPPYAIVGGVPAKVIRYRFAPELIQELMKIDYNRLDRKQILEHMEELYHPLVDVRQIEWML